MSTKHSQRSSRQTSGGRDRPRRAQLGDRLRSFIRFQSHTRSSLSARQPSQRWFRASRVRANVFSSHNLAETASKPVDPGLGSGVAADVQLFSESLKDAYRSFAEVVGAIAEHPRSNSARPASRPAALLSTHSTTSQDLYVSDAARSRTIPRQPHSGELR